MTPTSIQDILPLVEMPSRYLGNEVNRIKKDPKAVALNFALAFPDLYEIGSSHFGIQILYHLLNQHPKIAAERVFAPAIDMEHQLRTNGLDLFALESRRSIKDFDIIGFSLLYELTYTNVLNMLELSRIPFLALERDISHPLVIAGGPCTCNPEPMADVFDAMVIGDGEDVLPEMCELWLKWKQTKNRSKENLLRNWASIQGVYIPNLFNETGELEKNRVKRTIISDMNRAYFPEKPLIPFGRPVHDRLRLEISRGCSRGCRFCQAGMIYRPVRERDPELLLSIANDALLNTGYEDLSLLSLSSGDYNCVNELMKKLMHKCEKEHVAISLPSLRAGTLTSSLMEQIKKVRKTGFTIAPEAGSQRLRDVINKNITEEDIFKTVQNAFEMGWQLIKLYFMIGLPTETQDDLDELVSLVKRLLRLRGPKGRRNKLNVSVATFIPKAHTPFQWAPQISRERAWEIITYLRNQLNIAGVQFKWQNPDVSLIEGVMARGDRRLLQSIICAHKVGAKFDGWNEHFNLDRWIEAFEKTNVHLDDFVDAAIDPDSPLPWDHVDVGILKNFFLEEWNRAIGRCRTKDCRWHGCQQCGICDFKAIAPMIYEPETIAQSDPENEAEKDVARFHQKYIFAYHKKGDARFLGHLEMVRTFHRAIKRAGIEIEFSNGFHPMPKISFDNPLPIGMESEGEHFVVALPLGLSPRQFCDRVNQQLPDGLKIIGAELKSKIKRDMNPKTVGYHISIKDGFFEQKRLNSFIDQEEWIISKTNKKGLTKHIDLKKIIGRIRIVEPNQLIISLKEESGKTVRPIEIIKNIFELEDKEAKIARVMKLSAPDES